MQGATRSCWWQCYSLTVALAATLWLDFPRHYRQTCDLNGSIGGCHKITVISGSFQYLVAIVCIFSLPASCLAVAPPCCTVCLFVSASWHLWLLIPCTFTKNWPVVDRICIMYQYVFYVDLPVCHTQGILLCFFLSPFLSPLSPLSFCHCCWKHSGDR